ncbi:MAG: hypothetical protein WC682_02710 [Parcubacteria group bacterium]|jgi:hypothetical protein
MGKIVQVVPGRIFQTAQDKRNCFCCLMPILTEQLGDYHQEVTVCESSFSLEVIEKLIEIGNRLDKIFSRTNIDFVLVENLSLKDLVKALKLFRKGPIKGAGPDDLTYINYRIKLLIYLL